MNDPHAVPCAFCEIIAGREPAHVVWADDGAVVFLDHNPIAPGHVLIVPRRHATTLWDLTKAEYLNLMALARSLAEPLSQALRADRAAMAVEGYGVPHAHIHLVPVNGPGRLDPNRQSPATEDELDTAAEALHAVIDRLRGGEDVQP